LTFAATGGSCSVSDAHFWVCTRTLLGLLRLLGGRAIGIALLLVRSWGLAFGGLLASWVVRRRGGCRRRSLFASSKEFLHIFVVLLAEHASSLLPLQEQVVGRGDIIEAIFLNLHLGFVCIDVMVVDEHAHDLGVDRDRLLTEVNWRRVWWLVLTDLVPWMVSDILDWEALGRVRIENIAN